MSFSLQYLSIKILITCFEGVKFYDVNKLNIATFFLLMTDSKLINHRNIDLIF